MSNLDILYNIITSTFVVGLATYIIQKRIDKRFNKIEELQKTLITIRKERYDTLLKTIQEIWEKIVETEYYIRWDLADQVEKSKQTNQKHIEFDSKPLKNAIVFIEKRSILLTETLSDQTRTFFFNHLQATYNGYIDIIRQAIAKQKTIEEVNNFIPTALGQQYKKDIDALRIKFEEQARQILYEEK